MDQGQAAVTAAALTAAVSLASIVVSLRSSRRQAESSAASARAQAESAAREARTQADKEADRAIRSAREQREFYEKQIQEILEFVREQLSGTAPTPEGGAWALQALGAYRVWLADLESWLGRVTRDDDPAEARKLVIRLLRITKGLQTADPVLYGDDRFSIVRSGRDWLGPVEDLALMIDDVHWHLEREGMEVDFSEITSTARAIEDYLSRVTARELQALGFSAPYRRQ